MCRFQTQLSPESTILSRCLSEVGSAGPPSPGTPALRRPLRPPSSESAGLPWAPASSDSSSGSCIHILPPNCPLLKALRGREGQAAGSVPGRPSCTHQSLCFKHRMLNIGNWSWQGWGSVCGIEGKGQVPWHSCMQP